MKSEWKFFIKYVSKQFVKEIKGVVMGLKGVFRPKVWFVVFGAILIYQLYRGKSWGALLALGALLFIWGWDVYVAGAWKHEYRTETIKNIKNKVKRELDEYEKNR